MAMKASRKSSIPPRLFQHVFLTADYAEWAHNPGYNRDRGPVNIYAFRGHIEF